MIYVLIKLTRFVNEQEQIKIAKDLSIFFHTFTNSIAVTNDPWGSQRRLLVKLDQLDSIPKKRSRSY